MLPNWAIGLIMCAIAAIPQFVTAQELEKSFKVISSSLNSESERAELCFVLSQEIDVGERSAIAAGLQLEKDGVRVQVQPRDLSLTPTDLCLQQLEHRHRYRFSMRKLRSREGLRLDEAVTMTFSVPDRKPSLGMVDEPRRQGLLRYDQIREKNPPLIRALNIKTAQLTLYRIPDRKNFAEAMRQAAQIHLAPSESVYFAKQKGESVWQSELVFGEKPNEEQTLEAPLPPGKDLKPGLYFLAVMPHAKKEATPDLLTGQWFLVSGVRLSVITAAGGIYAFTTDDKAAKALPGVDIQVLALDGKTLGESKSGQDGVAALSLDKDKADKLFVVTAVMPTGDVDIVDLTRQTGMNYAVSPHTTALLLDREEYLSGSRIVTALSVRDTQGKFIKVKDSALKLLRPDFSLVHEQPVPSDNAGVMFLQVPLPVTSSAGKWHLLWQQTDGTVLAEKEVPVTPDGAWPKIDIAADSDQVDADGKVVLTIKVADERNRPLAWVGGRVNVRLSRPEFDSFKKYHFGLNETTEPRSLLSSDFLTSRDGSAKVKLHIPVLDKPLAGRAVTFTITIDGKASPEVLSLPVESLNGWLGIRPLPDENSFLENSPATFDIVALDARGKRHQIGDVYYQVYEEGRSFEWYQAEGHWDYRPLPQHRRVAGGRVSVASSGDTLLRFPVTAGKYVLELTNADGVALAQYAFQTGNKPNAIKTQPDHEFSVKIPSGPIEPKQDNKILFKLDQPAVVSVLMGDEKVRQIIHRQMKEGENAVSLLPGDDWSVRGAVFARALFKDGRVAKASREMVFRRADLELGLALAPQTSATAGSTLSLPVTLQKQDKSAQTFIAGVMTFSGGDKNDEANDIISTQKVDRDGRAMLSFALPNRRGVAHIALRAWNERQYVEKKISIPLKPLVEISAEPPAALLAGDQTSFGITWTNMGGAEGTYAYALTAPSGVRLTKNQKGSFTLKRQKAHTSFIEMAGEGSVRGNMVLEVKGPNNYLERRIWPITVRARGSASVILKAYALGPNQSLTLKTEPTKGAPKRIVMASPIALPNVLQQWKELLFSEPFTAEELARWLDVTKAWQRNMESWCAISPEVFRNLRAERLKKLEARQNADGGFSLWPPKEPSDLISTAFALQVLREQSPLAAESAARWLQKRLENTWFEESERPARARAFLALAEADRVDISTLRYFADTSRDKDLTPLSMADIALALAALNDDDMARWWLERSRKELPRYIEERRPDVWLLLQKLIDNRLQDATQLMGDYERAVAEIQPETQEQGMALLRSVNAMLERVGLWEIIVQDKKSEFRGLAFALAEGKGATITFKNPSSSKRFIAQITDQTEESGGAAKNSANKETVVLIERQLYRLDGTLVAEGESLVKDETYILAVHGGSKRDEAKRAFPLILTQPSSSGLALRPVGNADVKAITDLWPWLPSLTELEGVTSTTTGVSIALQPANEWRAVCLLKAERVGTFHLPPVSLRDLTGKTFAVTQSHLRWQVR